MKYRAIEENSSPLRHWISKTFLSVLTIIVLGLAPSYLFAHGCLGALGLDQALPQETPAREHQAQFAKQLTELFLRGPIKSITKNSEQQSNASYILSFEGTNIRAVLKKAAINDYIMVNNGKTYAYGKRSALAEMAVYQISERMGFHIFPFVVSRTIDQNDSIRTLNSNIQPGEYVVSLYQEGRMTNFSNVALCEQNDTEYGNCLLRDANFVRGLLFLAIARDSDGLHLEFDGHSRTYFAIDGAQAFSKLQLPPAEILLGHVPLNRHHYLNDRAFMDHLLALDAHKIFSGLPKQKGPSSPQTVLNYAGSKNQLLILQEQIRRLKAEVESR